MAVIKRKHSRAKERELERQRRYHRDDIIQPYDKRGKPNREFIKRYGKAIYNKKRKSGL